MVYKRFRVVVITRILVLSGTLYLLLHLIFNREARLYATILILVLIAIYQIYALIHYVEKTNRDLNRFLLTIRHEDFSQTFLGAGLGSSFDDLKSAFNEIIKKFHKARSEKEEHFRYLQTVVQHVGIGLIAFQNDGTVELVNTAAKKLLKKPSLKNISGLGSLSKPLLETLSKIEPGQKALVSIQADDELLQIMVNATQFRMREQNFTLVSLQNIQSELEEKEINAWQNLIRVLTHEIMNSVTPIASLASTINEMIDDQNAADGNIGEESRQDMQGGLRTIQKRSEALLHFVDAYRNLTRIPTPNMRIFSISVLFNTMRQLMQAEMSKEKIELASEIVPSSLQLSADADLVEQIMINIIKNAIQALTGRNNAKISMLSRIDDRGRLIIQIKDNGPGMSKEMQEKIFIPFFTTKDNGSGIGLSLSRQIMHLHKGTISVRSIPKIETTLTLRF